MFEVKRSIICKKRKQKSDNFLTTVPLPISCFISHSGAFLLTFISKFRNLNLNCLISGS